MLRFFCPPFPYVWSAAPWWRVPQWHSACGGLNYDSLSHLHVVQVIKLGIKLKEPNVTIATIIHTQDHIARHFVGLAAHARRLAAHTRSTYTSTTLHYTYTDYII